MGAAVGPELGIYDAAGAFWPVSPETGELAPSSAFTFYTAGGCTGAAYVSAYSLAGMAIALDTATNYRARDTTTAAITRPLLSQILNGSCATSSAPYSQVPSVPLTSLRTVQRPSSNFVGPIHRELR
jgi:hypothetical protein